MGNAIHKLSARRVATETKLGRHSDGGGLYLVVAPGGSRKWLFIFRRHGKQREMGLGAAVGSSAVSLADARARAAECRADLARGHDPIEVRRERKVQASASRMPTFGEFADQYIEAHRSSWRNEKHVAQWQTTLNTYAEPIREKPINEVTREDVLAILKTNLADQERDRISSEGPHRGGAGCSQGGRAAQRGESGSMEGQSEALTPQAAKAAAGTPCGDAIPEGARIRAIPAAEGCDGGSGA